MEYIVTMICREIWRAEVVVVTTKDDLEAVKDIAWARFDETKSRDLEQENYTKVQLVNEV